MEILLPYYYRFQPSTASTTTNNLCPATDMSKKVSGTTHRASATAKHGHSKYKNDKLPESDSDNDDASSSKVRYEHETTVFVQEPRPYDVLCGHDRNYNKHPGNQVYRNVIEGHVAMYKSDIPKQEKMNITRSILSIMEYRYGSRFIRPCCDNSSDITEPNDVSKNNNNRKRAYNNNNHATTTTTAAVTWQVLSHMEARDKISHALRSQKQRKKNTEGNSNSNTALEGMNSDTTFSGEQNDNRNNFAAAGTDTGNDMNIGLSPFMDMGHDKILLQDVIGHYGIDSSFDDNSISLDDTHTLMDLFGEGKGTPSEIATALNLDNAIFLMDDPPLCGPTKPPSKRKKGS